MNIIRRFIKTKKSKKVLCNAPFVSMSIANPGFVSPCCYINSQTTFIIKNSDRYPQKKLISIWRGANFNRYRECLKNNIFPDECAICRNDFTAEKYDSVKLKMYDKYEPHAEYPRVIEINADNTCNLQCVMCSSTNSSLIAKHNNVEIINKYKNSSFEKEFDEFIPFLEEIIFSGGESFLSPLYLRLIKNILSKNPKCLISVNTNGTILTDEIKQLMEMGVFHFNISIDSIHKATYEKIRIGANFDKVMENLLYFSDYSKKINKPITIPVCPLTLNYRELPEIVEFCNQRSFNIAFVHVFNAHDVALSSASTEILQDAIHIYEQVILPEHHIIQKQNARNFLEFIKEMKAILIFNQKKDALTRNLSSDDTEFHKADTKAEEKIYKYIIETGFENPDNKFERWKNKKNQVFTQLPEYFKNELFYKSFFDFPEDLLLDYFEQLPLPEIKNYMITFCNEIIRNRIN